MCNQFNHEKDKERAINKERRILSSRLANAIKFHREKKGLSMRDLAEKAGVSAGYISRIENGIRRNVSIPILKQLSESLDINLFYYLDLDKREERTNKSIEEILLENEFSIKGNNIEDPGLKELVIKVITLITSGMDNLAEDFSLQAKLLQLVHELNEELKMYSHVSE